MLGAAVNLELGEKLTAEPVLRQHSPHRHLDQPLGPAGQQLAGGRGADSARIAGMTMVGLLLALGAGQTDLGGVDDHHEIAAILMRREVGAMLAAQDAGDARGEAAEGPAGGIDQHPVARAQPLLARYADGLFAKLQVPSPLRQKTVRARIVWRGRWDLNPRLPT